MIVPGRMTAQIDGDFAVFLIGMRVNHVLRPDRWVPVARAMPRMLAELFRQPGLGFLHGETMMAWRMVLMFQYWRSFDHLHAYAHARDRAHLPAWSAFNRMARGNHSVGIFHETFLVRAGQYEAVYVDMPAFGLGRFGTLSPAIGRLQHARDRIDASFPDEPTTVA